MKRRTKDNLITALGILMGIVGLGLLLYPTVADWWNSRHMTEMVGAYDQAVTELDPREHDRLFAAAERFNVQLARFDHRLYLDDVEREAYYGLLDITGTGIMGYVGIPKMDVTIPIYHGTSEGVLRVGAGHLEGTSLPVGGKGTHSAITAHRGLPSARLFTDLNLLAVGDRFYITVLDRTLTYEVDQVRVVLPAEIDDLAIDPIRAEFAAGRVGMFPAPAYDWSVYTNQFPCVDEFDFIDPPTYTGEALYNNVSNYVANCGISKVNYEAASDARKKAIEEAWLFLCGDELNKTIYANAGIIPAKASIMEGVELQITENAEQWAQMSDLTNYTLVCPRPDGVIPLEGDKFETVFVAYIHGEGE